jgi:uncharacterized protein
MCVFNETCGTGLAIEHNGDLFACDHFVEPRYLLGNIQETHMLSLVASPQQLKFGADKKDSLPLYCLNCDVNFACHGECPKNRFIQTPNGEQGLNYLCAGFKLFFHHVDFPMKIMAGLMRRGHEAREVMAILDHTFASTRRHDPCPCGSNIKFNRCHGSAPEKQVSMKIPDSTNRSAIQENSPSIQISSK